MVGGGGALATTRVTRLPGRTSAPVPEDCEITVPAGWLAVDRYLTVARSPRSASAALALVRRLPTSLGTSTVAMVVGGAVVVVGAVVVEVVVTVGAGELTGGRAAAGPASPLASPTLPRAMTPRTTEAAASPTIQPRRR